MRKEITFVNVICDVAMILIVASPYLPFRLREPYHRHIMCDDVTLKLPHLPAFLERKPFLAIIIGVPLLVIILSEAYRTYVWERFCNAEDITGTDRDAVFLHNKEICPLCTRIYFYCGFFIFGLFSCLSSAEMAAWFMGTPAPNFLTLCKLDAPSAENCSSYDDPTRQQWTRFDVNCENGKESIVRQARGSCPAVRAALSFYSFTFCALYLHGFKLCNFCTRLLKAFVQVAFIVLAYCLTIERYVNNYNHWYDMLLGGLHGLAFAFFTYIFGIKKFGAIDLSLSAPVIDGPNESSQLIAANQSPKTTSPKSSSVQKDPTKPSDKKSVQKAPFEIETTGTTPTVTTDGTARTSSKV